MTDRQAADAVRSRLDWKYALSLELTDPGFDHTVLSEFRTRLVAQGAEERLLEALLEMCQAERVAQSSRQATHRLHPCVGQDSCPQPSRMCGGNLAPCPPCARRDGT